MDWRPSSLALGLSAAVAALALGCGSDGGGAAATPSPRPATATETAANTPTPPAERTVVASPGTPPPGATDIRNEDLAAQPGVQEVFAVVPGQRSVGETVYADLTGDGVEEAIANINSGGTAGHIAVFVFGYVDGQLRELLREEGGGEGFGAHLQGGVSDGSLVIQWPIYQPGDGNCCPTGGWRVRRYDWDGTAFVVAGDEIVQRTPPAQQ